MVAAYRGDFFPDWEFPVLFGVERAVLGRVIELWPRFDEFSQDMCLAIHNSLGNLVGYPHGNEKEWSRYISVGPDGVMGALRKLKRE